MNRESVKENIREQCEKILSDIKNKENWKVNKRKFVKIEREEKNSNDSKF